MCMDAYVYVIHPIARLLLCSLQQTLHLAATDSNMAATESIYGCNSGCNRLYIRHAYVYVILSIARLISCSQRDSAASG